LPRQNGHSDADKKKIPSPVGRITPAAKDIRLGRYVKSSKGAATAAWLLAALFYFYQYVLRSSPGVMVPQLSKAFGLSAGAVASVVGVFYYGFGPFSLVAGTALDRLGAKAVVPVGALMAGIGALLFATGNVAAANVGRFFQGAGGVFALLGAIYIIGQYFPSTRAGTLVGATQMLGSSGASAGQFLVGPMIAGGLAWNYFWVGMGILGVALAVLLFVLLPKADRVKRADDWLKGSLASVAAVFKNPQSILCGLIAGLLFIPTTIFGMIWGVRFLQQAHGFDYTEAVLRSAALPAGWMAGSPLMGWISDRIGRRKPVIAGGACVLLACIAWALYGRPDVFPPYTVALLMGVASGAAVLTYSVIKEANPPAFGGTATGVLSFLIFSLSGVLSPVFGWIMNEVAGGAEPGLEHYQVTFQHLLYGVGAAIVLTVVFMKETGPAIARAPAAAKAEAV
jgi:MFS family permease